jgi:hypothetical protein
MKKLLIASFLFAFVASANAQSKSVAALKQKYQSKEDFFNLELGGNFMNFAEGFKIDIKEDDLATVAKSIEKLSFFTLPSDAAHTAEFKALQKALEKERYDLLLEAAEGKSGVMIYSKGSMTISDLVILVGSKDESELMVVELKGRFTQEALSKATSQLN